MFASVVASIPSPSIHQIELGPFTLRFYGLMIGLGVIAATMLFRRRLAQRRIHPDTALEMVMWVVPAGIVGTRLYHVITDGKPLSEWHKIWEGGLGIPGGIAMGALVGVWWTRRRGLPVPRVADAIAPALPLAQAIGRWGNWWNQELFGRPSDLPWALEIDPEIGRIPAQYEGVETFHPTFLYESLWNFALVAFIIWVDRRKFLKPGKLIWVYTGGYALGRLWIESLRIDNATEILGLRVNIWTMSAVLLVSLLLLLRARRDGDEDEFASDDAELDPDAELDDGEDTDGTDGTDSTDSDADLTDVPID